MSDNITNNDEPRKPDARWVSEADALPPIGCTVLLIAPRSTNDFWDVRVVSLLARHEDVIALPVKSGSKRPVDYYWGPPRGGQSTRLITGDAYWAYLDILPLPAGAYHDQERGYHFIRAAIAKALGQ